MKTNNTVPGHIVISVFKTNLVLKLILLRAPILLEEASVNNLLCNNMALNIKYNRKNIGRDKHKSTGTSTVRGFFNSEMFYYL